jgi:hypothetical protein
MLGDGHLVRFFKPSRTALPARKAEMPARFRFLNPAPPAQACGGGQNLLRARLMLAAFAAISPHFRAAGR